MTTRHAGGEVVRLQAIHAHVEQLPVRTEPVHQDVQEATNFRERRVAACQVAVQGGVAFDQAFWRHELPFP